MTWIIWDIRNSLNIITSSREVMVLIYEVGDAWLGNNLFKTIFKMVISIFYAVNINIFLFSQVIHREILYCIKAFDHQHIQLHVWNYHSLTKEINISPVTGILDLHRFWNLLRYWLNYSKQGFKNYIALTQSIVSCILSSFIRK